MPGNLEQSAISTKTLLIPVEAVGQDGSQYNPVADVVQMAFMPVDPDPDAEPGPSDWVTASWETWPGPVYWAACLVGPANGGVHLATGTYIVWVKVTDNPDVPADPGATLTIF